MLRDRLQPLSTSSNIFKRDNDSNASVIRKPMYTGLRNPTRDLRYRIGNHCNGNTHGSYPAARYYIARYRCYSIRDFIVTRGSILTSRIVR